MILKPHSKKRGFFTFITLSGKWKKCQKWPKEEVGANRNYEFHKGNAPKSPLRTIVSQRT